MEKVREQKRRGLTVIRFVLRHTTLVVIALVATLVVFLGGGFERATASSPNAELEIQKLAVCYALGTDAIGRGNLQEGKDIYQDCFTENAVITAVFPNGASEARTGTDAWADFVNSVFQGNGYLATQHLIGSINISVQGNQATMSSYLQATHKLSETSIDVANGTYEDEVVKANGRWKINRRTLKLITFLNLQSPSTPATGN